MSESSGESNDIQIQSERLSNNETNRWVTNFPLADITPDPLLSRRGIGEAVKLDLFFPHYEKDLEGKGHVLSHITSSIPMEDLIQSNPAVDDLLKRQRSIRFPNREFVTIDEINEMTRQLNKGKRDSEIRHIHINEVYSAVLADKGNPDGIKADLTKPEITGYLEPNVNVFLALKLVNHPEIRAQFPTAFELFKYAQSQNIPLSISALKDGFAQLFETDTQQTFLKSGALTKEQLSDMYKRTALWLVELHAIKIKSVYEGGGNVDSKLSTFPYSAETASGRNPSLAALPYIEAAQTMYMRSLPEIIPEGKFYSLETMVTNINRTRTFVDTILNRKLAEAVGKKGPTDELLALATQNGLPISESVKKIRGICTPIEKMQNLIFNHYQKNEHLLNKTRGSKATPLKEDQLAEQYSKLFSNIFGQTDIDISSFLNSIANESVAETELELLKDEPQLK